MDSAKMKMDRRETQKKMEGGRGEDRIEREREKREMGGEEGKVMGEREGNGEIQAVFFPRAPSST